jgi:hypothetical protein
MNQPDALPRAVMSQKRPKQTVPAVVAVVVGRAVVAEVATAMRSPNHKANWTSIGNWATPMMTLKCQWSRRGRPTPIRAINPLGLATMTAASSKVGSDGRGGVASVKCCRLMTLKAGGPVRPTSAERHLREAATKRLTDRDAVKKLGAMTAIVEQKLHAASRPSPKPDVVLTPDAVLTPEGANRDGVTEASQNAARDRRGLAPTKPTHVPQHDLRGVAVKAFVATRTSSNSKTTSKVLAADCWPIPSRQPAKATNHAHVGAVVDAVAEVEHHAKNVRKWKAARN